MSWLLALSLVWGAFSLVHGFRVRAGKSRVFYLSYRTSVMWRNAPFAMIPFGIFLLSGAGAVLCSEAGSEAAVGVFTVIMLVALVLSLVWNFKPPEFMKPRWLRDVESGAAPEPETVGYGIPNPASVRRIYLPPPVYWGLWAATGIIFALWLLLEWPTGVLVGLGSAISLLAVHTPRKV
jgi:hypothetical protein